MAIGWTLLTSHPLRQQKFIPIQYQSIIYEEIAKLLHKKVIVETTQELDDFISPIFTRAKKKMAHIE